MIRMSLRDVIVIGAGPSGLSAAIAAKRRGLDYQVNVMVGDRASAETIDAALDAARSISAVPRRHD